MTYLPTTSSCCVCVLLVERGLQTWDDVRVAECYVDGTGLCAECLPHYANTRPPMDAQRHRIAFAVNELLKNRQPAAPEPQVHELRGPGGFEVRSQTP